ncbi:hypothetical protein ACIBCD_05040 [Nocardia brasiliensis]|uniref:hypothetical protein n=1 Tax=Nocardia brasiliensis TaxID=37326 RepID=UPI0024589DC7|nr:hypothetical protein [Nocardia brasiliensis]
MTRRTLVVVYAVDAAGATGEVLGAGTLIEPEFVLVDPPLNEVLAQQPRSLRVGVFAAEDGIAEVIDVARVRVVPDAAELVLLQLAAFSAAPVRGVPVVLREDPLGFPGFEQPSTAEIVAAVRVVLAEAPPPALPEIPVEDPLRFIFRLFGG